jgi:hypothetical protein
MKPLWRFLKAVSLSSAGVWLCHLGKNMYLHHELRPDEHVFQHSVFLSVYASVFGCFALVYYWYSRRGSSVAAAGGYQTIDHIKGGIVEDV